MGLRFCRIVEVERLKVRFRTLNCSSKIRDDAELMAVVIKVVEEADNRLSDVGPAMALKDKHSILLPLHDEALDL